MEPLRARLAHYVLLHWIAWFFTRADLVPLVVGRLQLLLQMVVIGASEVDVDWDMRLLFKVLQTHDPALPVDTLDQHLIKVLRWKDFLDTDLLLILLA